MRNRKVTTLFAISMMIGCLMCTGCNKEKPNNINSETESTEADTTNDLSDSKKEYIELSEGTMRDKDPNRSIYVFGPDENTLSLDETIYNSASNNVTSNSGSIDIGELVIFGSTQYVDYEVIGDDIVYVGRTYKGLEKALNSIAYPFDKNGFIHFILKKLPAKDDTVYVDYFLMSQNDDKDSLLPFDNDIVDVPKYSDKVQKYGRPEWYMRISGLNTPNNDVQLFISKDYVLILPCVNDIYYDVSELGE